MSKTIKIKNKSLFVKNFLLPISKISDSSILELNENLLSCKVCTSDNSVIFFTCFTTESDSDETVVLNCPDIKKLIRAIDAISRNDEISSFLEIASIALMSFLISGQFKTTVSSLSLSVVKHVKKITELSDVQTLQLSKFSFSSKIEESEILEIGRRKFFTNKLLFLIFIVFDMLQNYIKFRFNVKKFLMKIRNLWLFKKRKL